MATSLNALTLRINADTSGLAAGVKLARRDINTVNSALRRAAGDSGKAQAATQSLANVMASGAITQAEYARAQKAINDQLAASTGVTRRVNAMVAASAPPTQRLASQIRELTSEYKRGNITQEQFARTNRRLRADMQQTGSATTSLAGRLRGLVAAYVGLQAVTSTFRFAANLETDAIAFNTLTGSAERGKQVLTDLKDLAASTPLTLPGVSKAEKTLLGFGVSVEKTIPILRQLGDISGGNEERFQSLALVMAQVSANSRLNGQDLLQFVNAGFNPLNEMVKTTGKSMGQLREEMSKGEISTKMVEDALRSATSEGGLYYGMLEQYSHSASGQLALMATEVQSLGADLLSLLFPAIKAVAGGLRSMASFIREFGSGMSAGAKHTITFVAALGSSLIIIPKVVVVIGSIVAAIKSWIVAQATLQALSGPKGWLNLGFGLVAAAAATWGVSAALDSQDAAMASATETSKANAAATAANTSAQNELAKAVARVHRQQKSTASYIEEYEALQLVNRGLRNGTEYAAELNRMAKERTMLAQGYTQAQIDSLASLTRQNDALKKANKEEADRNKLANKEAEDQAKKIQQRLRGIGDSINKSMMTPYDNLVQKLAEISAAERAGLVNAGLAARARDEAAKDFGTKTAPIKVELPPSIARGSREEYKLLADRMNGNKDREEARFRQQLAIQNAQVDAVEQTNDILRGQEQFRGVS